MKPARLRWTILIAALVLAARIAGADTATISVGGSAIVLPSPEGFFRFDGKSTKVDSFEQRLLPAGNRMLARFGSEETLAEVLIDHFPKIGRHFSAQSRRSFETIVITPALFNEMKSEMRKSLVASEAYREAIKELEANAFSATAPPFQPPMTLKVGEMIALGIFEETNESLCFSMLSKVQVSTRPDSYVSIVAVCTLRVGDRLFYLSSSSPYHDKSDIVWARRSVQRWRDAVLKANAH